jgi:hypothetical protein
MRALSTVFTVALIVTALLWGNCLSCPQFIQASTHKCCPKNQQPDSKCTNEVLRSFVKASPQADAAPAPDAAPALLVAAPPVTPVDRAAVTIAPQPSPPDLQSLHSSFRI